MLILIEERVDVYLLKEFSDFACHKKYFSWLCVSYASKFLPYP